MARTLRILMPLLAALWAVAVAGAADGGKVTVGYQLIYNPWKVAIAGGAFERATGREIEWRRFDSGSKVLAAMASGDLEIGLAGSSPIAAGVSRGIDMQLFWILEDIGAAEALVVRDGSGIVAPADLAGKKLGVPFASTTHYHALFALEHFGVDPATVEIVNMQPNQIAAAWLRGQIDAAFVWNPALGRIRESGRVLITSGELSALGRPTFDGLVVGRAFAAANRGFMVRFVEVLAAADEAYRSRPEAWTPDSAEVRAIVSLVGGDPQDVPEVLGLYRFPTLAEQASERWLGGGGEGAPRHRAVFEGPEEDPGAPAGLRPVRHRGVRRGGIGGALSPPAPLSHAPITPARERGE